MKRDDEVVGVIASRARQTGPFPQRQIDLLRTFADQAVIAIENARLFNEVQARTRELEELLRQQTATADVLKVIGRSAFDLETVLHTLIGSARTLCEADFGAICLREGDLFHAYATAGVDSAFLATLKARPQRIDDKALTPRVARTGRIEHISDRWLDPDYQAPPGTEEVSQPRTLLGVPLLRDGRVEGTFVLMRVAKNPFSQRNIDLAQTFADQAMIAIGNVRLFDEVKARTRELEESLAQQTATADVLKVISRSVFDLNPVLQTLIDTAVRLARGSRGTIWIRQGDALVASAFHHNVPAELRAYLSGAPRSLSEDDPMARAARDKAVVHIPDFAAYQDPFTEGVKQRAAFGAGLWVPLIRDGETIGVFGVPRDEPIAFTRPRDRNRQDLRRPGGDRDRERAAVRAGAGQDARPRGVARPADRDRRRAEGHQPLGVRSRDCPHRSHRIGDSTLRARTGAPYFCCATAHFGSPPTSTTPRLGSKPPGRRRSRRRRTQRS